MTTQIDPIGLKALAQIVAQLSSLKRQETTDDQSKLYESIDKLEESLNGTVMKYDLLCDRYALLKRSNAELADELVWLRDQCDDLSSSNGNQGKS